MFAKQDIVAEVRHYAVGPEFAPEMGFVEQNVSYVLPPMLATRNGSTKKRVRNIIYNVFFSYDAFYDHGSLGRRGTAGAE